MHPRPLTGQHPLASFVLSFLSLAFESSHGAFTRVIVVLYAALRGPSSCTTYHLPLDKHRATLRIFITPLSRIAPSHFAVARNNV